MNILVMIFTGLLAGFASTMNVWADQYDDVRFHINDVYMVILMVSWMIAFMIPFEMDTTHMNMSNNDIYGYWLIAYLSAFVITYLIKSQTFVNDKQFLKGMIPHHSMAVRMARKIKDKTCNDEIKVLADNIIKTQQREIFLMKKLERSMQ